MDSEKSEKKTRFQVWYAANREKLAEDRKRKYSNDPAYKARVKSYREKKVVKRRQKRIAEDVRHLEASKAGDTKSQWREYEVNVESPDGTSPIMTCVTISALAQAVGCSVQAVRLWERQGVIPETPYRTARGVRLYLPEVVLQLRDTLLETSHAQMQPKMRIPLYRKFLVQIGDDELNRSSKLFFRASTLAGVCNRRPATIASMERKGRLPVSPIQHPTTKHRLYTKEMLFAVREGLKQFVDGVSVPLWLDFTNYVEHQWRVQGVYDMQLLRVLARTDNDLEELRGVVTHKILSESRKFVRTVGKVHSGEGTAGSNGDE